MPQGSGGVLADESLNLDRVLGMQGFEGRLRLRPQFHGSVAETDAANMMDKGISAQQVTPACLAGPHAEVVFLAVTEPELAFIEAADRRQASTAHIHAKANPRWNFQPAAGIRALEQSVEFRQIETFREEVCFAKTGIAANSGIV